MSERNFYDGRYHLMCFDDGTVGYYGGFNSSLLEGFGWRAEIVDGKLSLVGINNESISRIYTKDVKYKFLDDFFLWTRVEDKDRPFVVSGTKIQIPCISCELVTTEVLLDDPDFIFLQRTIVTLTPTTEGGLPKVGISIRQE